MKKNTLRTKYATDTMGLILFLENRKLPKAVKELFDTACKNKIKIYIPIIVLTEILYLSEKKRISVTIEKLATFLSVNKSLLISDLNLDVIKSAAEINDINELHDRLIAADARRLNIKLITNDPSIRKSKFLETIWGNHSE